MKKKLLKFIPPIILLLIAISILFQKQLQIAIADLVYDSKIHLAACKDLPTIEEVEVALTENSNFVREIEDVKPGFIDVEVGLIEACPGKADILIYFPGHAQREEIEEMIGGDLFFGIPYRMINI